MGRIEHPQNGLAAALFSGVRLRLLAILFGSPHQAFHASEVIRLADSGSGAVQRELKRLSGSGILKATEAGNRKLYQANPQSPIFEELVGLVRKTVGLVEPLRDALKAYAKSIDFAFVYGSVAKGADSAKSDIDVMIVGESLSYSGIYSALQKAEKRIQRPVNPTLFTPAEWRRKREGKGSFVRKVSEQPKLFILGSDDALA